MRGLAGLFGGRRRPDAEAVARIREWSRAALGAGEDTAFAINEIVCNDPSCPGMETVVLVMEPGRKTRAVKIPKSLAEVTEQDVLAAVAD